MSSGRQPFGLASPAAWLRELGAEVACLDLSREPLGEEAVRAADLVAFYVPMHTATRLAVALLPAVREMNPRAHICFYGLYAPVNENYLRGLGVDTILGGEFEEGLAALTTNLAARPASTISLARQKFRVPDRRGLVPLGKYAHVGDAGRRIADRRIHGGEPRLQASMPALPHRSRLQRHLSSCGAGRGVGGYPPAG